MHIIEYELQKDDSQDRSGFHIIVMHDFMLCSQAWDSFVTELKRNELLYINMVSTQEPILIRSLLPFPALFFTCVISDVSPGGAAMSDPLLSRYASMPLSEVGWGWGWVGVKIKYI